MRVVQCEKNHFYDSDKYTECPECKRNMMLSDRKAPAPPPVNPPERETGSNRTQNGTVAFDRVHTSTQGGSSPSNPTIGMNFIPSGSDVSRAPEEKRSHGGMFKGLFGGRKANPPAPPVINETPPEPEEVKPQEMQNEINETVMMQSPDIQNVPETKDTPEVQSAAPPKTGSLAEAVAAVSQTSQPNSGKTVAFYNFGGTEPVVGWLVSIKGTYKGESFNLKAGQNFIGRSLAMDVVLKDDQSVSRENHAAIMFEPKRCQFFLMPGQSSGITYLNDVPVMTPTALSPYDILGLGNTELCFVPFCGEKFKWDESQE